MSVLIFYPPLHNEETIHVQSHTNTRLYTMRKLLTSSSTYMSPALGVLLWLCDCVTVWLYGCVTVWLCDCVTV